MTWDGIERVTQLVQQLPPVRQQTSQQLSQVMVVFREDRQAYFEALEQSRVAEDLTVFIDFMRGQHGKYQVYQLSAAVSSASH